MAFKHVRKNQFNKHQRINSSTPSKWPGRIAAIVLVLLVLVAGGYDFPGAWNQSVGKVPGLTMFAPDYRLGLDLLGGTHLVYEADLSEIDILERQDAIEGVRDVIERRVNAFGVAEPLVQTTKGSGDSYRVIVELAGIQDVNEAINQIGETPILEFKRPDTAGINSNAAVDEEKTEKEINEEKFDLAFELLTRTRTDGEDFDQLVAEYSEGPQRHQNGVSSWVDSGDARSKVLPGRGHDIGKIYINVLEKDTSYSVVKYHSEREVNEWLYSELTVCYEGASGCEDATRSQAEARRQARLYADEATPDTFASLVKENSDDEVFKVNGGDKDWNRQTNIDANIALNLSTKSVEDIFVVSTSRGEIVIHKRAERPYSEYRFQEIELLKAGVEASTDSFWVNTELSGANLKKAGVEFDQNTGVPYVTLLFDSEGGDLFGDITEEYIGQQIAIFLDGEVISAPVVQAAIYGGEAIITGIGDLNEARILAQRLNAGALPVPIELLSQQTVGPTLGATSLDRSLNAALIGVVLVAIFMLLYYRLPGLISVVALTAYGLLVLAIFKFLPVTLTLSGLAGFILSVGMAVDANVLIFERLKEELKMGRALDRAIDVGFKRAWTSIRDGNLTTLIACVILYWLSSSFIQGFALTLGIGILMSMFSAIVITRMVLKGVTKIKSLNKAALFGVKEIHS